MQPVTARRTWEVLEPVHGLVYFLPEVAERYAAAGVTDRPMSYFGSRAAAMGAVSAELVVATFYNFAPELVRRAVPEVWRRASPEALLAARISGIDAGLRRALPAALLSGPIVEELAVLVRRAALAACERLEGRPLFAAHAALPWPDEPHLVVWHGQTLLRECRGDNHIAALLVEGLGPVEALVSHAAAEPVWDRYLHRTRGWSEDVWEAAVERLRSAGLLVPGQQPRLSEAGTEQRARLEGRTDAATAYAYEALGDDGCARLRALALPLGAAVVEARLLPVDLGHYVSDAGTG